MGCKAITTRHGTLALRLNWTVKGETHRSQETLQLRSTPDLLAVAHRDFAVPIAQMMRCRQFTKERYLEWFPFGAKARAFRGELQLSAAVNAPSVPAAAWAGIYYRTKKNAVRRGIPFRLLRPEFDALVHSSLNVCHLTGIAFDWTRRRKGARRPFAPSLDRIDSSRGYERDNVRLVCVIVNLAMNEWGFDALLRLAQHLVATDIRTKRLRAA